MQAFILVMAVNDYYYTVYVSREPSLRFVCGNRVGRGEENGEEGVIW